MTRRETDRELAEIRAQIARLQGREAFLLARLQHLEAEEDSFPRPGWPIQRAAKAAVQAAQAAAQTSGRRISTASPSRIAL